MSADSISANLGADAGAPEPVLSLSKDLDSETWVATPASSPEMDIDRPSIDVDIACTGFGPAIGGFLTTLTQAWHENPADPACRCSATSEPTT